MMSKRPHIVLFNPDQWRGDVMGHLGNSGALTPRLDAIVEREAVSFRHAYCQNPACTPSRCSFMSGWYPHVRGHRTMLHMMQPDEPVLLRTLKHEGYHVWWGGKNDLVSADRGFDAYCSEKAEPTPVKTLAPPEGWRGEPGGNRYYSFYQGRLEPSDEPRSSDWDFVHAAVDKIKQYDGDEPLCLYLPLIYPHPPYGVEEPWYGMIDRNNLPERIPAPEHWEHHHAFYKTYYERAGIFGWSEEEWRELRAVYYGMCARVDHQFGMVMDALKEAGMYDDTAVFFFSDHGDFTGDYGLVQKAMNVFPDCLVRVPFVVKPPADCPVKPGVRDALVELVDLSATVEALTGIEPGHTHFGRSLLPLIAGSAQTHRDAVFCEGGHRYEERQCKDLEMNTSRESLYWPQISIKKADIPEVGRAVMCRTGEYKYIMNDYDRDQLYDLRSDPGETRNMVDDPGTAQVVARMKDRLLTFFLTTSDVVPFRKDLRETGGKPNGALSVSGAIQ